MHAVQTRTAVINQQQVCGVEQGIQRRASTELERAWTDCKPIDLNLVIEIAQYRS